MINSIYQLVAPRTFVVKFEDVPIENRVIVRPRFMAICHADQRYFQGKRSPEVMRKKLPMALIHEAMGEVVFDPSGNFSSGDAVVLVPNIPGKESEGIYENYAIGSGFRSSGIDGFMRELVSIPVDRVVGCDGIPSQIAAITEFVSVAVHAVTRFKQTAHSCRERIAVIGDGSMAYAVSCVLKRLCPDSSLVVVGRNENKLNLFSFSDKTYLTSEVPSDLSFDHAFECAGGEGSGDAIDMIISHIKPQGSLMLLGVSENPVPVRTRDVLEKGMVLTGCSRSGRADFEMAIEAMQDASMQRRLRQIVHVDDPVLSVGDMKRVFATDLSTPFKTVFKWAV